LRAERSSIEVFGFKGDRIFYRKSVLACGGTSWHEIAFEYPAEAQGMNVFVDRAAKGVEINKTRAVPLQFLRAISPRTLASNLLGRKGLGLRKSHLRPRPICGCFSNPYAAIVAARLLARATGNGGERHEANARTPSFRRRSRQQKPFPRSFGSFQLGRERRQPQ
jgi:hypothetical protein